MTIIPPPWTLHGDGYVVLYKFSRAFAEQYGFVPQQLKENFKGLFGAVMLVNYESSPAGPYRELLFIPGQFHTSQGRRYSITRIFVDSEVSTQSGSANWGIPKFTRTFQVEKNDDTERIQVLDEAGAPFFDITFRSGGWRFPVTTTLFPIRLYQNLDGRSYFTRPGGSGKAQWAKVLDVRVNPACFPDISLAKPLLAVKITRFRMEFPLPSLVI